MGLRGQLLEMRNEGRYQFFLRVGIYDDLMPNPPSIHFPEASEDEGLPFDKEIRVYECRLDFSDAEKPVSYPLGDLTACMEVYESFETPENLHPDKERLWKIAFIVDTIIAEAFSTDVLEVIYGDDFEQLEEPEENWQDGREAQTGKPPETGPAVLQIRCPDCGAGAKSVAGKEKQKANTYACEICGRYFAV